MIGLVKSYFATIVLWVKRLILFGASLAIGYEVYRIILTRFVRGEFRIGMFLLLWIITAYVLLPRVHRFLTKLYVPDYFIGRVRTIDGLLGDPVTIAFNGSPAQLEKVFKDAGWAVADPITFKTSWKMVTTSLLRRSYPTAPVSSLFLFGHKQDIAFQKEVNGNPHARHHIRFWHTPDQWWLPGGTKVDWLGAATYDRRIGFSLWTGQITHKIAEKTDEERDFTWQSLEPDAIAVQHLKHFMSAYRDRNGGGDNIVTDGTLVIVTIKD